MSREIRNVPVMWEHPKKNGRFEPLWDNYVGSLKYWKEEIDRFIECMTEVIETGKTTLYDKEWTDEKALYEYFTEDNQLLPPKITNYMPSGRWFQLYEGVSEGTPLSPAFSTKEELVDWLTNNKDYWGNQWSRNQAEKMVEAGYSPSGLIAGGKFLNSQEALEI